jgi:molybdopterin synthase sulfur carrier subunit
MKINIISFGSIAEKITEQVFNLNDVVDTDQLKNYLETRYPSLKAKKYTLALDSHQVQQNTSLSDGATVAIMPPFSGG